MLVAGSDRRADSTLRRIGLLLAVVVALALAHASPAAAATASTFANLTRPLGVATNAAGEVYASHDNTVNTLRTRFSAAGQPLVTVPVGGLQAGDNAQMDVDPATGVLWDLSNTGTVRQFDPGTLQLLTQPFSVKQIAVDTTNTFDAALGVQRDMTGYVIPSLAAYGDIAVGRSPDNRRLDVFVTGKTSANVKFVVRLTWIDTVYQGARSVISTTAFTANDGAVPGVAVNAAGTVLTTMANHSGALVGPEFVARAWIFSNAWPEAGFAPRLAFDGIDLSTTGITADANGLFYAVGPLGTSACGQNASDAIVMLLADGRPYACQPNALLASLADIAVSPSGDVAYTTGSGGVRRWDRLAPAPETLTVAVSGPGSLTSSPSGISCPPFCTAQFAHGTRVALTAFQFYGNAQIWGDACVGSFLVCTVDLNGPRTASITFQPAGGTGAAGGGTTPGGSAGGASGDAGRGAANGAAGGSALAGSALSGSTPGPAISALTISPSSLRAGRTAKLRYTLSRAANVALTAERRRAGRKGYAAVPGSLTHSGKTGRNTRNFAGRIGGKSLRPGCYRLIATPTGGAPLRVRFRVRG